MEPAACALKVQMNCVVAPEAIVVVAGQLQITALPVPVTTGVTPIAPSASAPPLFVTESTIVMSCPTLACEGKADIEAVNDGGACIAIEFVEVEGAFITLDRTASKPTADELKEIFPALAAMYIQVKSDCVFLGIVRFKEDGPLINETEPVPLISMAPGLTSVASPVPPFVTVMTTVIS